MSDPQAIAEALRKLQSGDATGALAAAMQIVTASPSAARGHLVAGLALRMLGRLEESRASFERAAALDPQDYAAAFELGMALQLLGDTAAALPQLERSTVLRPAFQPARQALAQALRHSGRASVSKGEFARAAQFFAAAVERDPADAVLPIFLFQAELLLGHWERGWAAYRRRETRSALEATLTKGNRSTRIPSVAELAGKPVTLIGEQGLGDTLFFLRFAPALKRVATLHFVGDARLHPLLARTGLFDSLRVTADLSADSEHVMLLTGDLPEACRESGEPCPAALRIAPDLARLAAWRTTLQALGPKPWIGVTWRSGTPHAELAYALHKTIPIADLMASVKMLGGTVVALQRSPAAGELEVASGALGAKVHDLSAVNGDLEDALAVIALLDRHVGVSSTNMHLAAAAGNTADVLVPFPPEWRWGLGDASAWFKGFRVLRQASDGDWSPALASVSGGNKSRA